MGVTIGVRLAHFYGASRTKWGVKLFGPTTSHLDLMTTGSSKNKPTQTDRPKDAMCLRYTCFHHHKMVATTLDLSTVTRHNNYMILLYGLTKNLKTQKGHKKIELYL